MENRLDKLFRDHLSKHEEIPSAGSWNQLQDQLIKKRRVVWGKRLAVAASILLIAAVGIVQYQSLVSLDLKNNQVVTKSDQTILENENQITQKAEEIVVENVDIDEQIESQISKNLQEENVKNTISGRNTKAHRAPEMPEEVHKRQKPLVAEAEVDDQKVIGSDDLGQINTRSIEVDFYEKPSDVQMAENTVIHSNEAVATFQKKTYPSVKITYKATANSSLVDSEKKNILDKGIHKIAEFSNDYLLTADRKSKLRNTKEELLALNFGKLLTKSDKEFEN